MIKLDVTVNPSRSRRLDRFRSGQAARLSRGVDMATNVVVNEIKKLLSQGGSAPRSTEGSRSVPRNLTNRLRVMTGALRSSWRAVKAALGGRWVEGHVITRSPYAAIHEFGGQAGRGGVVRLRARRYVRPALAKKRKEVTRLLAAEFLKPLRRG